MEHRSWVSQLPLKEDEMRNGKTVTRKMSPWTAVEILTRNHLREDEKVRFTIHYGEPPRYMGWQGEEQDYLKAWETLLDYRDRQRNRYSWLHNLWRRVAFKRRSS